MFRYISSLALVALSAVVFTVDAFAQQHPDKLPKPLEELFQSELNQIMGREPAAVDVTVHRKQLKEVLNLIATGTENVQFEAELLFQKIVVPDDVVPLIDALPEFSAYPKSQAAIVKALGKIRDPLALPVLKKEYTYENRLVQLAILEVFGTFHDDSVVPLLSTIIRNATDSEIQRRAILSLARIGDAQAKYAIESSFTLLPPGAPQITAQWVLELMNGTRDPNRTDTSYTMGKKQLLYFKGMLYYLYRPVPLRNDEPNSWLLVCAHGSQLNAEETFDTCFGIAKQYRIALLVPFFDPLNFPEYETFNVAGERSDIRYLELVDHVRKMASITAREIYMFGFEKGGEFIERISFFYPDRVARSAFYTKSFFIADPSRYYPNGTKTSPLAKDLELDLTKVIKTDFAILLDPSMSSSKAYKSFYNALVQHANETEQVSRVRPRNVAADQTTLQRVWAGAHQYLFSTCS